MSLLNFLEQHSMQLLEKLIQHIYISFTAVAVATCIAIPTGILITRKTRLRNTVLGISNVFQTIPSLALLSLFIPLLGIGLLPTIVTLVIYAFLPIVRNTYTGIIEVPKKYQETSKSLGLNSWQRLTWVEIPIAMPIIIAGLRTATAMIIGITTIAAFIGAGGLGDFITQGLALDNSRLILLGAIPTALLALTVDFIIARLLKRYEQPRRKPRQTNARKFIPISIAVLLCALGLTPAIFHSKHQNSIIVASKNFTEQFILGNIIADMLQAHTTLHVIKKFNLGSTSILQNAMLKGAIDIYPEYTGTAYLSILHQKKIISPKQTYAYVKHAYKKQFKLSWLTPFGFTNSQTLAINQHFSQEHHIKTLSQLKPYAHTMTIAAPEAFFVRPDGLPNLHKHYHLHFKKIITMQPDLTYQAVHNHDADVIEVFTTDPRISLFHLQVLQDNLHSYPDYAAAPIVRMAILKRYPEIKTALVPLANLINTQTMRQLNREVNIKHLTPAYVAKHFLQQHHLI